MKIQSNPLKYLLFIFNITYCFSSNFDSVEILGNTLTEKRISSHDNDDYTSSKRPKLDYPTLLDDSPLLEIIPSSPVALDPEYLNFLSYFDQSLEHHSDFWLLTAQRLYAINLRTYDTNYQAVSNGNQTEFVVIDTYVQSDQDLINYIKADVHALINAENFHIYQRKFSKYCAKQSSNDYHNDLILFYKDFIDIKIYTEDYFKGYSKIMLAKNNADSSLDLSNLKQISIFPEVFSLSNLKHLFLSNSNLHFISEKVSCLVNLTFLDISHNKKLRSLPYTFPKLLTLEDLKIDSHLKPDSNLIELRKIVSTRLHIRFK